MGVFVSFEGGDGAGKGTQSRLLADAYRAQGADVILESYPRYTGPVGHLIGNYLNGKYGSNLHPELAGSLYSFDRLEAKNVIERSIAQPNGLYIADRFGDSNKGHQGGKIRTDEDRIAFFDEQDAFEHTVLGIPKPDRTILMPVPPELAQRYIDKKAARSYTEKKRDIHEADVNHLQNAYDAYILLAAHEPERIIVVDPVEANGQELRTIESIHAEIMRALRPLFDERLELGDR